MATVNFSVPDEVKEAFNRTFAGRNKSAIIARLMREAVDAAERREIAREAFRQLTSGREDRKTLTDQQIREARERDRP